MYTEVLYNVYKCCKTFIDRKKSTFSGSQLQIVCMINFDFKKYIEKVRGYTTVFIGYL